jgi:tRNA(Ile)-lysidine synthase
MSKRKQVKNKSSKEDFIAKGNINKALIIKENDKNYDFYNQLFIKIETFLDKEIYFNQSAKVLLAVSGGVDSISLLDIFANLTSRFPLLQIAIAHFNHNLRAKESDDDEKLVRDMAIKYNISYYTSSGQVRQYSELKGVSIEQAARYLRYKFFERIVNKINADYVATAHTADDNAETFFINLFRGSGITGLSGIPIRRNIVKRASIIRPLIKIRKSELIEYAKLRKLEWREDESNKLMNYTRNKVRLDLLPKLEEEYSQSIVEIINRTQNLLQGADNVIAKYVQKAIQTLIINKSNGRFGIKLNIFKTYDEFLQGEILQKAIINNFSLQNLSLNTIDRIKDLQDKPVGSICELNKNYFVLRDRNQLLFIRKEPHEVFNIEIEKEGEFKAGFHTLKLMSITKRQVKFTEDPNIEYVDADLIPTRLFFRSWEQGDSFNPLGMSGTMLISDFLTNQKISLADKKNILILSSKSEIIWICGMRLSDKFKVTESTKKYLKLEYNKLQSDDGKK